jgi:hypothetical protein
MLERGKTVRERATRTSLYIPLLEKATVVVYLEMRCCKFNDDGTLFSD